MKNNHMARLEPQYAKGTTEAGAVNVKWPWKKADGGETLIWTHSDNPFSIQAISGESGKGLGCGIVASIKLST
jgi:hypothetical protein